MNIAVWDTYFKKPTGSVLHFDILVPESQRDTAVIYAYGREYLAAAGVFDGQIAADQCQFCHVEAPTDAVLQAIRTKGHYILEMEEIPADLPPNPTRRDMILHLRAHHAKHRFANFSGVPDEELKKMTADG